MFFRKSKLPVTTEDKKWVDESLEWLRTELGKERFMNVETVVPTKEFYDIDFDGSEKSAELALSITKKLMCIKKSKVIELNFFSDSPVEMSDGSILTTPGDMHGKWKSVAGLFEQHERKTIIYIERNQLNDPVSLIATIAHELAHEVLLGDHRIDENDEYLTDLTAIALGFGIFLGNSRFKFSSFTTSGGHGWQSNAQGYLPEQVIGYAMAALSVMKNEPTDYKLCLKGSIRKHFQRSLDYIEANKKI